MSGLEALQSVQYVTAEGKRLAVVGAEEWEALIEWLETLEDSQIARQAFAELKAAGGDRKKAGWLEWEMKAMVFEEFTRDFGRAVEQRGLTEDELMAELDEAKQEVFRERYAGLRSDTTWT